MFNIINGNCQELAKIQTLGLFSLICQLTQGDIYLCSFADEFDLQTRDKAECEKRIRRMREEMIKLNVLIARQSGAGESLEQTNSLLEMDFVRGLKQAEKESIEMQDKLQAVREEKERLLNSLVEAERQIMLWEKKTQLARETKAAVDSEVSSNIIDNAFIKETNF